MSFTLRSAPNAREPEEPFDRAVTQIMIAAALLCGSSVRAWARVMDPLQPWSYGPVKGPESGLIGGSRGGFMQRGSTRSRRVACNVGVPGWLV